MKLSKFITFVMFFIASFFISNCLGNNANERTVERFLDSYNRSDTHRQYELIEEVAKINHIKHAPFLRKLLNSGIDELKVAAITALGNISSSTDRPLLREQLSDQNYLIRVASAQALLNIGDNSGVETLSELLLDSESHCSVIPLVIEALSLDKSETSVGSLKNYIESDRCLNNYEGEALLSLGKISGSEPVNYLIDYLKKTNKKDVNRSYAIEALGLTNHSVAIDFLTDLSKYADEPKYNKLLISRILQKK